MKIMKHTNICSLRFGNLMLAAMMIAFVSSCNKSLPQPQPINYTTANPGATQTIGQGITSDTSFSFYLAAATKSGMISLLSNPNSVITVFAPDNNAFRNSGIPSLAVVNSLPVATLGGIVQYSIVPGIQYSKSGINSAFPNMQLPTSLNIGTLPGTPVKLEMTTFPSTVNGFWINNIPVVSPDIAYINGVLHKTAAIVAPPTKVLKDAIYSDPNLSYFKAAIARGDSGQTGLNSFDFLLGYAVTNMTVLVPNNAAFQQLITGSVFTYLSGLGLDSTTAMTQAINIASSPAVFSNPDLFSVLTASTVRGILAYHLLASNSSGAYQPSIRVFSNNFALTPTFYPTMVNSSVSIHPGILVSSAMVSPSFPFFKVTFTGMGTFPPGGQPYSGAPANAVSMNNTAVNGVYYVIDKVLLPQ